MSNEEIILQQLNDITKEIKNIKTPKKVLYTNQEMLSMLDISSATLKKWRNYGYIGYSQIGSTYYYSAKDLEEFLNHSHNEAYAYQ